MMQTPAAAANGGASVAAAPASDPFLADDFHPLESASAAILDALRADEASPDSDLNRRLATGGATAATTGGGAGGGPGGGGSAGGAPPPTAPAAGARGWMNPVASYSLRSP